ncbi:MAG: altronate dehydratase [Deltaproteobacteria bacterium]|nr:altronate dehydratase [Deltaproteobacteria bacterium]
MILMRIHEKDNVAVALQELKKGETVSLPWGGQLTIQEDIPVSHKVSLEDLDTGQTILRYGQPIGEAVSAIPKGSWIHTHSLRLPDEMKSEPESASDFAVLKDYGPSTFLGFTRPKGPAGIRNHLLVLPSVACACGVVRAIGRALPEAATLEHGHGCGRGGKDWQRTLVTLRGIATNPNVGAVLVVGLGCEAVNGEKLAELIASSGKPVEYLEIQKSGGSQRTAARGVELGKAMLENLSSQAREPHPISEITVGLQCGGSDALSGVTANPAVGLVSDWIVSQGGTAILAETTEMLGTTHLLQARAADSDVAEDIRTMISNQEAEIRRSLGDNAHLAIAPGNMDGGLSSIMEKSLGCINKGGNSIIRQVVDYAEQPTSKGLILMDTPGYDIESLGGLVAGGSQLIIFTSGRPGDTGWDTCRIHDQGGEQLRPLAAHGGRY